MALPQSLIQAVRRYGPSVQGIADQYHLSGAALLAKLIQGESGGVANRTSPAGAKGYTQFMPSSRQVAIQKYGVDPWADPDQAVHAAALHLRGKINGSTGLSGYNPGDPSYTNYILGQKVGDVGAGSRPGRGGGSRVGSGSASVTVTPGSTQNGFDPGAQTGVPGLVGLLSQAQAPPVGIPVAPTPAIQSPLIASPVVQGNGLADALAAIQTGPQSLPTTQSSGPSVKVSGGGPTATAASTRRSGTVRVAPGANAGGKDLTPGIRKVLGAVAGVAGPITVGTGTNHSKYTVDGNISDHYSGNAADLPTTPGQQNIRLGRQALIAAGMPRAQAEKAQGGIYDIPYGQHRRIQVIFNTNAGGNHHNHVHVGVTGR
jgi:hypothetical protein